MKKTVALLLLTSMLIGLAACSKSEETTKKKKRKTKKTATTEITEIETETEIPSDSGTDPIPTDTDPIGQQGDFIITHDLYQFIVERDYVCRMYGAIDPTADSREGDVLQVEDLFMDELVFPDLDSKESYDLQQALTNSYSTSHATLERQFEDHLNNFYDCQRKGESLTGDFFTSTCRIFRCDSQFMSVNYSDLSLVDLELQSTSECHNFRASDGSRIENSDVIKDADGLRNYLKSNLPDDPEYDELFEDIGSADPYMALTYDGVIFPDHQVKVSAMDVPEAFDLSYFFSTPDRYSLYFDLDDGLTWDFDGDGTFEELTLSLEYEDSFVTDLIFTFRGETYDFTKEEIPSLEHETGFFGPLHNAVSFTPDGQFIFVTCERGTSYSDIYVFRITSDGIVFVNEVNDARFIDVYDPSRIYVSKENYALGRNSALGTYSLNSDGSLADYSVMKEMFGGVLILKQDFLFYIVDEDSWTVEDEIVLKEGTPVSPWWCEPNAGEFLFKVLNPDESKTFLVYAQVIEEEGTIFDTPITDVFAGISYGIW